MIGSMENPIMTDIESNGGFTNICHDFPRIPRPD